VFYLVHERHADGVGVDQQLHGLAFGAECHLAKRGGRRQGDEDDLLAEPGSLLRRSRRGKLMRRPQEFRIEHLGGHHLTAADQPDLIRAVIR
jgi:hypothetical protein